MPYAYRGALYAVKANRDGRETVCKLMLKLTTQEQQSSRLGHEGQVCRLHVALLRLTATTGSYHICAN